jgi:hypothetical protein
MLTFRRVLGFFAAGLLGLAITALGTTPVHASDDGDGCAPACHYEMVTVYVPKTVAYTKCVTFYDHCGRPYQGTQTCYRTIQVPVRKCVLVCDR